MDGCPGNRPATVQRRPVDIEWLLQWAYERTAYVSYRNTTRQALWFNHGYTAIPKGCHNRFAGGEMSVNLRSASAEDAKRVVAAVEALDPWSAAIVSRCAKKANRPDCFAGVEAREVETRTYPKRRGRNGRKRKVHKAVVTKRWEPCHPSAIRAAREIYERWHAAVARLAQQLDGRLTDWSISGFAAPAAPWEAALEKTA